MIVKLKRLHPKAIVPKYQTSGASGFDLHAYDDNALAPGEIKLIATGWAMEIVDPYYEIQIRPRSGLAIKNSITVFNSPGTVDADYRGEVMVMLVNFSNEIFHINAGDRIAQAVLCPIEKAHIEVLEELAELTETERADGGFGSTDKE